MCILYLARSGELVSIQAKARVTKQHYVLLTNDIGTFAIWHYTAAMTESLAARICTLRQNFLSFGLLLGSPLQIVKSAIFSLELLS